MPDNVMRGVYLLSAAVIALLLLVITRLNDGSDTVATVAGAIAFWCGAIGIVLLLLDLRRR